MKLYGANLLIPHQKKKKIKAIKPYSQIQKPNIQLKSGYDFGKLTKH